jgi:hypothetical protein
MAPLAISSQIEELCLSLWFMREQLKVIYARKEENLSYLLQKNQSRHTKLNL